jgi:hypothetical protein
MYCRLVAETRFLVILVQVMNAGNFCVWLKQKSKSKAKVKQKKRLRDIGKIINTFYDDVTIYASKFMC